jgi:peptidoglycan L-alanyl-D-glutamate endopeptidase CwlK
METTVKSKINKPVYSSRDKEHLTSLMKTVWMYCEAKYKELYPLETPPFLSYTYRSNEAQNDLYASGRTKKGPKVTFAKAGQSPHNFFPSFAFDIAFLDKDNPKKLDWSEKKFVKFSTILNESEYKDKITWGGSWPNTKKDMPHFEQKDWKSCI